MGDEISRAVAELVAPTSDIDDDSAAAAIFNKLLLDESGMSITFLRPISYTASSGAPSRAFPFRGSLPIAHIRTPDRVFYKLIPCRVRDGVAADMKRIDASLNTLLISMHRDAGGLYPSVNISALDQHSAPSAIQYGCYFVVELFCISYVCRTLAR